MLLEICDQPKMKVQIHNLLTLKIPEKIVTDDVLYFHDFVLHEK